MHVFETPGSVSLQVKLPSGRVLVTTADERLHVGRLVGEEDGALLLLDSYGARSVSRIPRDEIVEQSESPVSPMPEALLDTLTRDEIYDLVAYQLQDAD